METCLHQLSVLWLSTHCLCRCVCVYTSDKGDCVLLRHVITFTLVLCPLSLLPLAFARIFSPRFFTHYHECTTLRTSVHTWRISFSWWDQWTQWFLHEERKNSVSSISRIYKKVQVIKNLSWKSVKSSLKMSPNSTAHKFEHFLQGVWGISPRAAKKCLILVAVYCSCVLFDSCLFI